MNKIYKYDICAYWGARKEQLDACTDRLFQSLSGLMECDPIFNEWYKRGWSRKKALRHQVSIDKNILQELLDKGRHYTDIPKKKMDDLGFSVGLWNGKSKEDGTAGLDVSCGVYSKFVGNNCIVHLPREGTAVERIYCTDMLEKILRSVVRAWKPDWGLVSSYELRTMVKMPNHAPEFAWLLYLDRRRGKVPILPPPSRTVAIEGFGTIIVVTDELFDIENAYHIEILKKVYKMLGDAGLLEPVL